MPPGARANPLEAYADEFRDLSALVAPVIRRRFVIVTYQRTGSTMLVRSLDSSPDILCAGELFHRGPGVYHGEHQYPHRRRGSNAFSRLVDALLSRGRVMAHLRSFYETAGGSAVAVGFKLMTSHAIKTPAVVTSLRKLGVRFLYLHRRDIFSTALSYCTAKATGLYHSDREPARQAESRIVLDTAEFKRVFDECGSSARQLMQLRSVCDGPLYAYEDMIEDWETFVARIGVELGLPELRIARALSRLRSGGEIAAVANERELRSLVAPDIPVPGRRSKLT